MKRPMDFTVLIRFLAVLFQVLGWMFAFFAVSVMPLGTLMMPAMLALLCVLAFDVWRQQRRRESA